MITFTSENPSFAMDGSDDSNLKRITIYNFDYDLDCKFNEQAKKSPFRYLSALAGEANKYYHYFDVNYFEQCYFVDWVCKTIELIGKQTK